MSTGTTSYRDAGVDIEAGERGVELMKEAVRGTYDPEVLAGVGAFGGLFDAAALRVADDTILVASSDGVGTKTMIASQLGHYENIGFDIVNHCVNDILVQGARPLFFLDYIAAASLDPVRISAIVKGVASACTSVGAALLGGETAEMPGVYEAGSFDLVGTIVGVVRGTDLIDGSRIQAGDAIVGLASNGLHTNGYTLARAVFKDDDLNESAPGLDGSLGEVLLAPHTCYLSQIEALRSAGIDIHGLAHITGGGIPGNLPRILPDSLAATLDWGTWPVPAIFGLLRRAGNIPGDEMFRVFNMGLGMLVIVPAQQLQDTLKTGSNAYAVGTIVPTESSTKRVEIA